MKEEIIKNHFLRLRKDFGIIYVRIGLFAGE
jgi:hypothetical protein